MENAWTVPDHFGRFRDLRQELHSNLATDHREDFERSERQINAERESFSYMVETQDRYA